MDPPKKVIRATTSYTAASQKEVSFKKGDFFHVIARENDTQFYYVSNPLMKIKGLVPVSCFETLETRADKLKKSKLIPISSLKKTQLPPLPHIQTTTSQTSLNSVNIVSYPIGRSESESAVQEFNRSLLSSNELTHSNNGNYLGAFTSLQDSKNSKSCINFDDWNSVEIISSTKKTEPKTKFMDTYHYDSDGQSTIQALVLYNFVAESKEELSVSEGDRLLILAQSTNDWYVAELYENQGSVGLVPVSYVALIKPGSNELCRDPERYMEKYKVRIPTVEEWKRLTLATQTSSKSSSLSSSKSIGKEQGLAFNSVLDEYMDIIGIPYSNSLTEYVPNKDTMNNSKNVGGFYHNENMIMEDFDHQKQEIGGTTDYEEYENDSISPFNLFPPTQKISLKTKSMPGPKGNIGFIVKSIKTSSFIWKNGKYLFLTEYRLSNNKQNHVYKSWEEFCRAAEKRITKQLTPIQFYERQHSYKKAWGTKQLCGEIVSELPKRTFECYYAGFSRNHSSNKSGEIQLRFAESGEPKLA
ncbi:hypothetical protein BB559_001351 [Furculomyces boomerangus]|uniref:SH3 domain-containing protein n=1 Tax=Furculomyces boomerangus TaxID=61424 RepID=A0A2T9Z285_9FUNG|nr:hypothetical protein BB559_001351 [Furculomyces boomerangus]